MLTVGVPSELSLWYLPACLDSLGGVAPSRLGGDGGKTGSRAAAGAQGEAGLRTYPLNLIPTIRAEGSSAKSQT